MPSEISPHGAQTPSRGRQAAERNIPDDGEDVNLEESYDESAVDVERVDRSTRNGRERTFQPDLQPKMLMQMQTLLLTRLVQMETSMFEQMQRRMDEQMEKMRNEFMSAMLKPSATPSSHSKKEERANRRSTHSESLSLKIVMMILREIPVYDGRGGVNKLTDFVDRIDSIFPHEAFTDNDELMFISGKIAGDARHWYNARQRGAERA
ncbi:hypothetical protein DFJ77DRAFT_305955 [Powellomyces hirtus]|nr:hypothetical protein DFJ77DRAFT_305955 [Powellomyces hirtus]